MKGLKLLYLLQIRTEATFVSNVENTVRCDSTLNYTAVNIRLGFLAGPMRSDHDLSFTGVLR